MKTTALPSVAVLCLTAVTALSASATDWPHWRGPQRDGHSTEDSGVDGGRLASQEPAWKVSVGQGCSAPIIAAGRLYAVGWEGGKDHVRCLDAATGKQLWTVSYACPQYGRYHKGDEDAYAGPSATPEFDRKRAASTPSAPTATSIAGIRQTADVASGA
jgi:hypothetical protein